MSTVAITNTPNVNIVNTANVSIVNTANVNIVNTPSVSITPMMYKLGELLQVSYATAGANIFSSNLVPPFYPASIIAEIVFNATATVSVTLVNSTSVSFNVATVVPSNLSYIMPIILNTGDSINFSLSTTGTIGLFSVVATVMPVMMPASGGSALL